MRTACAYDPISKRAAGLLYLISASVKGPGSCRRSITEFAGAAGAAVPARDRKASDLSTPLFSSQSRKTDVVVLCEYYLA